MNAFFHDRSVNQLDCFHRTGSRSIHDPDLLHVLSRYRQPCIVHRLFPCTHCKLRDAIGFSDESYGHMLLPFHHWHFHGKPAPVGSHIITLYSTIRADSFPECLKQLISTVSARTETADTGDHNIPVIGCADISESRLPYNKTAIVPTKCE